MHNIVKMRKNKYDVTQAGLNLIQQSKVFISFSLVSCIIVLLVIFLDIMSGPLMPIGGPSHPAPAQFKHCLSLPKKGALVCGSGEFWNGSLLMYAFES